MKQIKAYSRKKVDILPSRMSSRVKRIPVTKEGFEKLQEELSQLQKERPAAVKTLADARSMGDLSENGLYTAAKARLRSIDSQLFRLEIQIKLADIIEGRKDLVTIGSSVRVKNGDTETVYQLVGDYEANPLENKISQHSPLGKVLIGKKMGETVNLVAPKGSITYKIISIS